MTRLIVISAIALAGCATGEPIMPPQGDNPRSQPAAQLEDRCGASQVRSLIGRTLDDPVREQAGTASGARVVRVIRPGEMVTMDYNSDRLNIEVDEQDRITGVRCG